MTDVALASGFESVRRFNEIFQDLFHRPPSALRRRASAGAASVEAGVTLRLRYKPPYDWESMLSFLQARSIPGIELVECGSYRRTVEMDGFTGSIEVAHLPQRQSLGVTIHFPNVRSLPAIVTRVRRVFDLGADIETIDAHLSLDPRLAPLAGNALDCAHGGWDGFELAVRAILGQQISTITARHLAGRLVALHGKPVSMAMLVTPDCRT